MTPVALQWLALAVLSALGSWALVDYAFTLERVGTWRPSGESGITHGDYSEFEPKWNLPESEGTVQTRMGLFTSEPPGPPPSKPKSSAD